MKYKLAASWSCPFGYKQESSAGNCTKCTDNGQFFHNLACLASCPSPYIADNTLGACTRCSENKIYYNRTCVDSCPLTTFLNASSYTCEPCAFGCDNCTGSSKYSCLFCSEGFFIDNGYCSAGCPTDMYANPDTRVCEQCQPPCITCSRPDSSSCTSCPTYYYLLNGTCVQSCPSTHYIGFLGEFPWYQTSACLPKLILSFKLKLKTEARKIEINFNYGISTIMPSIVNRIKVQIANTQVDSEFYAISAVTESMINFEYLGDQHIPALSFLNITIDLDSDFNSDPYQQFMTVEKSQTIQLKEIYPFTKVEIQTITASSNINNIGASLTASGQVANSIAAGGASLGLVRMQLIAEIIQLLRFVDIRWPASVNQLFTESHIDPGQMTLPVDFMTSWNENLENFNTSLPRVFINYEVSLFITENYSTELSNFLLLTAIVLGGFILIKFSRTAFRKITADLKAPKTKARRTAKAYCIIFLLKVSRLLNRIDLSTLWNIEFLFLLSIYQSGVLSSLVNVRYFFDILDPATIFTNASLGIAIGILCCYSLLTFFVFKAVLSNLRYIVNIKENLWPQHIRKYRGLFVDFECKRKMHVLFVPLSLIRCLIFSSTAGLLTTSPETQITLLWCTQGGFVAYMIIFAPLKDKWNRRITLFMELMAFGCMSFGFIIMIIEKFGNVDADTLNETGFTFIAFSLASTLSGGILCWCQVLGLLIQAIKYIKELIRRRREVHPVTLSQMYLANNEAVKVELKLKPQVKEKCESDLRPLTQDLSIESPRPLERQQMEQSHWPKASKVILTLPSKKLNETSEGKRVLESVAEWWRAHGEDDSAATVSESTPTVASKKRDLHSGDRFQLFAADI